MHQRLDLSIAMAFIQKKKDFSLYILYVQLLEHTVLLWPYGNGLWWNLLSVLFHCKQCLA